MKAYNEQIKKHMDTAKDRVGSLYLHIVHVFSKDPVEGTLEHRSGYFEQTTEAQLFADLRLDEILRYKNTGIVVLDGDIIGGFAKDGEDLKFLLADDDMVKHEQCTYLFGTEKITMGE